MGSMSSPYNSYYKDCSTGICSIYCPQWCYIVFPPPPPFAPEDDSGTNFSPLVIAVIGILASAFLLIAYYTLISKYCRRRRSGGGDHQNPVLESESTNLSHTHHDQWQPQSTSGLDQALIESITVCCYRKGDGLVEGTECAVCLSEFEENEKIRLLPKCSHAFHLPCIDMWLKSHSNCPLCRANVISGAYPLPQPDPIVQNSSNSNVSSLQVHPNRDLIVVVEDPERVYRTEEIVEDGENDFEKFRRSASLGSFPYRGNLLVSDILQIREEDDEIEMVIHKLPVEIGSSRGICPGNSMEIGRSISTGGRFSCTMHDKGKNSVNPD